MSFVAQCLFYIHLKPTLMLLLLLLFQYEHFTITWGRNSGHVWRVREVDHWGGEVPKSGDDISSNPQHLLDIGEQSTKMLPTILQCKDRQKILDTGKIQDTNDVMIKEDTGGIANEDTLLLTEKVRWKDMENESIHRNKSND